MSDYIIPAAARSYIQLGNRSEQQDARFPNCDTPEQGFRTFIVCDGVGGEQDGAIASATVCQAFADFMEGYANPEYEFTLSSFRDAITFAYHRLLKEIAARDSSMATTLTFVHVNARNVMVAHIGDSRVYHIRPGVGIMYRTYDHSLVNSLVHSGVITPTEAINHPDGNVITRAMSYSPPGADPSPADVILLTDIEPGDYFLLCTDGVIHEIDDQYLMDIFSSDLSDDEKINVMSMMTHKSTDNNTAMFVRIEDAPRYGSSIGDLSPNDQVETVSPTVTQPANNPTGTIKLTGDISPEIEQVYPDNALPFHKKIAARLRSLLRR